MLGNSAPLGPLRDRETVAIIGAGPGGLACALTIQREAARRGITVRTLVFEGKDATHYKQCSGVLSPPLQQLLRDEFAIELPALVQREIQGYVLHTEDARIALSGVEHGGTSLAVRRQEFDTYLRQCAQQRGVEFVHARVTDLEFRDDGVWIFSWNGTYRAKVVVGAFGLSRAMLATLSARTAYRPPAVLETVVTKWHPGANLAPIPDLLDNYIHVMLPALPRIEFGALIPKGNHIAAIIAGEGVRTEDMDAFLALPEIRILAPATGSDLEYFKGRFPVGLARGSFGDRYVTVGDAAGLVRPFKGKGINSAIITGMRAAGVMMTEGVSAAAFRTFYRQCAEITGDIPYGRLVRRLACLASHHFSLRPLVRLAQQDPALRALLFDCVSGRETYRNIVLRPGNFSLAVRVGLATLRGR